MYVKNSTLFWAMCSVIFWVYFTFNRHKSYLNRDAEESFKDWFMGFDHNLEIIHFLMNVGWCVGTGLALGWIGIFVGVKISNFLDAEPLSDTEEGTSSTGPR